MADKEYYSFEEVLKDLKLEENELKRLVSAGEIRAFRDKNTMRFKAEDVARLRSTGPESADVELDDLDLDLDDAVAPPAVPVLEEPAEELVLEEAPVEAGAVEEIELTEETVEVERPARATRETKRVTRVPVVEETEPKDSPLVVGALLAGEVLLLIAAIVIFDAVSGTFSNPVSAAVANMFG
ncbi:MAG TPA: helix-turn-helix domain-containing protein [Planctomycetota bacterium]|nr:helix-turn-helix domain-containing protein [Planctomycetota bacterium]